MKKYITWLKSQGFKFQYRGLPASNCYTIRTVEVMGEKYKCIILGPGKDFGLAHSYMYFNSKGKLVAHK